MDVIVSYESSSDDSVSSDSAKAELLNKKISGDDTNENKATKRQLLPVPEAVKNMFNSVDDDEHYSDDPKKHCGKIRSFAHERGNWASYVYIKNDEFEKLLELTGDVLKYLQPSVTFVTVDDLHLSLSRTFVLRHHWIESLLNTLRTKLKLCTRCMCQLSGIELYCNDELTRTFLGVKIGAGYDVLLKYVKEIDSALQEFKLPSYYEDPSFHISIAWAHGDVREKVTDAMKEGLENIISDFYEIYPTINVFQVKNLCLKTGNKSYILPLG